MPICLKINNCAVMNRFKYFKKITQNVTSPHINDGQHRSTEVQGHSNLPDPEWLKMIFF